MSSRPRSRAGSESSADDGLEEAKLGLSRVADGRVGLVAAEEREELRELPPCGAELVGEPVGVLAREVVADRLDEREVRERELGLAARAPEDLPAEPLRAGRELGREARLAHAGLAAERDEAALAAVGRQERVFEDEELVLAADQGGAEDAACHDAILPALHASPDVPRQPDRRVCARG